MSKCAGWGIIIELHFCYGSHRACVCRAMTPIYILQAHLSLHHNHFDNHCILRTSISMDAIFCVFYHCGISSESSRSIVRAGVSPFCSWIRWTSGIPPISFFVLPPTGEGMETDWMSAAVNEKAFNVSLWSSLTLMITSKFWVPLLSGKDGQKMDTVMTKCAGWGINIELNLGYSSQCACVCAEQWLLYLYHQ